MQCDVWGTRSPIELQQEVGGGENRLKEGLPPVPHRTTGAPRALLQCLSHPEGNETHSRAVSLGVSCWGMGLLLWSRLHFRNRMLAPDRMAGSQGCTKAGSKVER